jgi:hypothetical protein
MILVKRRLYAKYAIMLIIRMIKFWFIVQDAMSRFIKRVMELIRFQKVTN